MSPCASSHRLAHVASSHARTHSSHALHAGLFPHSVTAGHGAMPASPPSIGDDAAEPAPQARQVSPAGFGPDSGPLSGASRPASSGLGPASIAMARPPEATVTPAIPPPPAPECPAMPGRPPDDPASTGEPLGL